MKIIATVLAWACIVAIFVIVLETRFAHPDMSETRLFLTFWLRWLVACGLGVIATVLSAWPMRRPMGVKQ